MGEIPYRKDVFSRRKFWKEPLRGTKVLFCWRGSRKFFFNSKRYQFNNTLTDTDFFQLNTLKGTAKGSHCGALEVQHP